MASERRSVKRQTSIHDLGSAPAAPDSSSLSDLSASSPMHSSPKPEFRKRRSSLPPALVLGRSASARSPNHDGLDIAPRVRSDTAPGRLGNIPERDNDGAGDMLSYSTASNNHRSSRSIWHDYDDDEEAHYSSQRHNSHHGPTSSGAPSRFFDTLQLPSMARISSFLVRNAPCFWGCGRAIEVGSTDRTILYRLNLLCAFFALGEVIAASFLLVVLYSKRIVDRDDAVVDRVEQDESEALNIWNLNATILFLGLLASITLVTVLYTLRIVREVDLRGSVRYLWIMVWVLPLQIFFVVNLFDYHRVTQIWVKHWWSLPTMAWFRQLYCAEGTANEECIIPVGGGFEIDEKAWCQITFNATTCTSIRDEAQGRMIVDAYIFYFTCAIWGVCLVILIILTINMLEGIITKPIVQSARESNVPAWMLLPTVGCLGTGFVFVFSASTAISGNSESTNSQWVGVLYIICGGCFFISALLGWFIGNFSILNSADKRTKNLAVICFVTVNILIAFMLAAVFAGSILVSSDLVDVPLTDAERGRTACDIDTAQSCTLCGNRIGQPECPEWTEHDVITILQAQYKQSATLAAIFFLYAISALRFGFMLRRHISMYQIDYV